MNSRVIPECLQQSLRKDRNKTQVTMASDPMLNSTIDHLVIAQARQSKLICQQKCQICEEQKTKLYDYSECGHLFCKKCISQYIQERMRNQMPLSCCSQGCEKSLSQVKQSSRNQERRYFWKCISRGDRKKIKKYLLNLENINKKCQYCFYDAQVKRMRICNGCMEEVSVQIPDEMQKCPQCRKIIEKTKGCDHLKCVCGFEFCFYCGLEWSHSHICEKKVPERTGISFFGCWAFKVVLLIPLTLMMVCFFVLFSLTFCMLSSLFIGAFYFIKLLQQLPKADISDGLKFLIFMLGLLALPLFFAVGIIPGFFLPLLNICYAKKIFFEPDVLSSMGQRLFGCLLVIRLI